MALTKPLLLTIDTFDAKESKVIEFQIVGGDQIFHNELEIYNNSTNVKVYSKKITSFAFEHTIPLSTLTNGIDYYARLRTYNINNQASVYSDNIYFKCLLKPIISIPTVASGKVNNQTVVFQGEMISPQDKLRSYRYVLYDTNKVKVATTPNMFDGFLKYEFTGFLDDVLNHIELIVTTQNNVSVSTGLLPFTADFVAPRVKTVFNLYNNPENASIKLDAKIIQMFYKSKKNTYSFENGTWINLNKDTIYLDESEGFSLNGDFTLKIIATNLKEDIPFNILLGKHGSFEFVYFGDRIHCYKKLNGIKDKCRYPHYMTIENFKISETDIVLLYIQSINDAMNMQMEKIV